MLIGEYNDGSGHVIGIKGYDFGSYMPLFVYIKEGGRNFWDNGVDIEEDGEIQPAYSNWDRLYVQVNSNNIKIDDLKVFGESTRFNLPAFGRMGAIIRGLKDACIPKRSEFFDGVSYTEEFLSKPEKFYYFESVIEIKDGNLYSVLYENEETGESLYLKTVNSTPMPMKATTTRRQKAHLDLEEFTRIDDIKETNLSFLDDIGSEDDDFYTISEIIRNNPDKSYDWIAKRNYKVVSDREELKILLKCLYRYKGVLAFDTETTGLTFTFHNLMGRGDKLVGIVLSVNREKFIKQFNITESSKYYDLLNQDSWYIPFAHKKFENICKPENTKSFLDVYFKKLLETKDIACHNGSFDAKVMFMYGIKINLVHDSLILLRLSWGAVDTGMSLGLKPNAKRFLKRDSLELSDFVKDGAWGSGTLNFSDLPYESTKFYACPDTDSTLALIELAESQDWYSQFGMRRVYELEVAFTLVVAYQEFFGHHFSTKEIDRFRKELEDDVVKYRDLIYEIAGAPFNIGSSQQLGKVLYQDLGLPILEYTASGNPSTSKNVLKKFANMVNPDGTPQYPIMGYIQAYKDASKLQSDFIKNVNTLATPDGFMFSSVKQFLETGRLSVSNPNYQSYSDTVKKYISPREGYYMADTDYSSVEIRIMMSMAKETELINYLYDIDADYHRYKASQMFSIPYELVTSKQRGDAKGVNFGIVYGMGDVALGARTSGKGGEEAAKVGAKLRKLYFNGMGITERFIADNLDFAVKHRYAETFFGRRRYFPDNMNIGSVKRQGGNHPIQGTAADLFKQAMVNLYGDICRRGWWGQFLIPCFVHDEAVFEIHNSIDPALAMSVVKKNLMLDLDGWCPLYIGFGFGRNWYNAKKTEIPVQVQNRIIDDYSETGMPGWDGNVDKLYLWEVKQIQDYKRDRIISYLKDENVHGKTVDPVISGFLFELMGYLSSVEKSLGKYRKSADNLLKLVEAVEITNNGNTVRKILEEIEDLYYELVWGKVNIDYYVLPFMEDIKAIYDMELADVTEMVKNLANTLYGISPDDFIDGTDLSSGVKVGGILDTLDSFGELFSVSNLVETAGLLDPSQVEVKQTQEEDKFEVSEEDLAISVEEKRRNQMEIFGRVLDYENRTIYIRQDLFSNQLLSAMVSLGLISSLAGKELLQEAADDWNNLTNDTWRVIFSDIDFNPHPALMFINKAKVQSVSTIVASL